MNASPRPGPGASGGTPNTSPSTSQLPAGLVIVPLVAGDIAVAACIDEVVLGGSWPASVFAGELEQADRCYLAARLDATGALVGYGGVALLGGDAHVMTLAVDPEHQGRGYGRALLDALLAAASELGADAVTLEVRRSNRRARRLYGRAGFVEEGVRPGYYPDGEDAVVAWRR